MRILMLSSAYLDCTHGGVEAHVYYLGRELVRRGHDVLVLRLSSDASVRAYPRPPEFMHRPQKVFAQKILNRLPGRFAPVFAARVLGNLSYHHAAAIIRAFQPDVVHHHDFIENYRAAVKSAEAAGAALVWTNHLGETLLLSRSRIGRTVLERLARPFDAALAPSQELLAATYSRRNPVYCPNGVDAEVFSPIGAPRARELRRAHGIPEDKYCIIVPRRWAPTKGVLEFVRAIAPVRDGNLYVLFAGADTPGYESYADEVRKTLSTWTVPYQVIEAAPPELMPQLYQMSDLAAFPSFLEATSLAILEAMGAGCLTLGTNVGGIPELIEDEKTGFLCADNSRGALMGGLQRARELSRSERQQITSRARSMVETKYSWSSIADIVESTYVASRSLA